MFTNDPLVAGVTLVRALHFTEARTAVNALRTSAGLGTFTFTDLSLNATVIKATHLLELRTALNAARSALSLSAITYATTITAITTPVRAVDVTEIRTGVK